MQIQQGYANLSSLEVSSKIFKSEGIKGFFRGCIPPLWGSMIYRGIMMSSYEAAYTYFDKNYDNNHFIKYEFIGVRPMVLVSIVYSSVCRCVFEGPIEYAKVMGQTGKNWILKEVYRGFQWQVMRTTALLIPIFTTLDICRRKTTILSSFYGYFFITAGISGGAYLICWPLETLKNLSQSGTPVPNATFNERINYLGGYSGLYRGVWPGTLCGALRNGCAMVSMVYAQKLATSLGLRD